MRLRDVIGRVSMVDPASISDNGRLLGFGIDSIRLIELVMNLEEEFSIKIEPEQLFGVSTVRELASHIEGLTAMQHDVR